MAYSMKIKGRRYSTPTLGAASAIYRAIRNASGLGSSKFPSVDVTENGRTVARISYNGNVWPPLPWAPDMKPLLRVAGAPA